MAGEGYGGAPSAYQPFQPEPEDELVLPPAEPGEAPPRVDNTPPGFDDRPAPQPPLEPPPVAATPPPPPARIFKEPAAPTPPPVVPPVQPAAPAFEPPPVVAAAARPPVEQAGQFEPEQPYDPAEPYDYRYPPPDEEWGRRGSGSGMGPLAIGGFVLLGILAIAVGAVMAGLFSGGVAQASPTPTPSTSVAPSPSVGPSVGPSTQPSLVATPAPSTDEPVIFPDGFIARTEPCAEEPSSQDGCNSSGATISGGSMWVWIGWRSADGSDVLGATIVDAAGTAVADASIELGSIRGCGDSCNGWARFRFSGLAVGDYKIRVERNGQLAAVATFTVTG